LLPLYHPEARLGEAGSKLPEMKAVARHKPFSGYRTSHLFPRLLVENKGVIVCHCECVG
jgi:hypothetical protein